MTEAQTALTGSWKSPITSNLIVSGTVGIGAVAMDGDDIYWLEGRPSEGGRNVLVKLNKDGVSKDMTPPAYNVRTRVHEYGGGAFLVVDGTIYFSNFTDQRIYKQTPDEQIQPLTQESKRRYADYILDKKRDRLICVCEDHSNEGKEPENRIISIDINTGEIKTLVSGSDFYCCPRISHDGEKLAYLSWNHPHMPWDMTQLWVTNIDDGLTQLITNDDPESICQLEWSVDGVLYFSSDKTGWWNLYRYTQSGLIESLFEAEAEFGFPHWVFGESVYGLVSSEQIICTYTKNGSWYLGSLDLVTKELQPIEVPYTSIHSLQVNNHQAVFIGGSPNLPTAAVKLDVNSKKIEILKLSSELTVDPAFISIPIEIAYPTENGLTAYAWFYPPKNKNYTLPANSLPPLVVKSHGGPTAAASSSLNLKIQYWTSRGFAILDVNYGGSTGYGRAYRQRLEKNWGIVDVDDCVNGAKYLVQQKKVDAEKLAIAGGSAGGYTTLAALTFRDTFRAGASYYGVSDLEALAQDTHKFEARYLDGLIGAYPEEKEIYQKRSPINFPEKLSCPVIFFQGLEDKVVPPNQTEMMVEAIKAKSIPVAYVAFPGEQHGFRNAANIKRALDGEYFFYCRIFGLSIAENIEPVEIMNLK